MFRKIDIKKFKIKEKNLKNKINSDSINLCFFINENLENKTILELGAGSGLISIFIEKNFDIKSIDAIEIENETYSTLKENVILNDCKKIRTHHQDIKNIISIFEEDSFDIIISNPPYYQIGNGKLPENYQRKIGRHEVLITMSQLFSIIKILLASEGLSFLCYPISRNHEVERNGEKNNLKILKKETFNSTIGFYKLAKN